MKIQIIKKGDPEFKDVLSLSLKNKRHHLEKWTREMITGEIRRTRNECVELRLEKGKGISFIDKDGNIIKIFGKPEQE